MISLGTLLVQQILLGEDSKMTSISYMRSKLKIQGDQGDAWYKGVLFLEATNLSFRVRAHSISKIFFIGNYVIFYFASND